VRRAGEGATAVCRHVAMTEGESAIPKMRSETATRTYAHMEELVAGAFMLMQSDLEKPTIIGGDENVTVGRGRCVSGRR
jgi:hypothetical protein